MTNTGCEFSRQVTKFNSDVHLFSNMTRRYKCNILHGLFTLNAVRELVLIDVNLTY